MKPEPLADSGIELYNDASSAEYYQIQGDQKVSVHLMITIQKVTSIVQSVPRQSPDIYSHAELGSRTPGPGGH
jgi:hypothetical protein